MILGYLLPKDKSFEFKYLIDCTSINHPEADSYAYNEFAGAKNSVSTINFGFGLLVKNLFQFTGIYFCFKSLHHL